MDKVQSTILSTAHHVLSFLRTHEALMGPNLVSARRNLNDAVGKLEALAVSQASSIIASQGATARARAQRTFLRTHHMNAVRQVAKQALPDVPQLSALTAPTRNLSHASLVAVANGMADAAEPYEEIFISNGMPDQFIAALREAADALTQAGVQQREAKTMTSAATASMRAEESRIRKLLKLLNALVVPRLGTDAGLLREWRSARAIDHQSDVVPMPTGAVGAQAPTVS